MNKAIFFKQFLSISLIGTLLTGCAMKNNEATPNNNSEITKTGQGAILGGIIGALLGATTKSHNRGKRAVIGGILGAAAGTVVGYTMDQQAKQIAQKLDTNVDNSHQAMINPDNDLIISNTDKYVKITLRNSMVFDTNSSIPTREAARKIDKIADVLKDYPNTLVQVVGFTDSRGTYEYNQKLSEERARNVGNTFYNSGIPNKVFSKGCSYNKPLVPNKTKEDMALNRRVEVYLYSNQQDVVDTCMQ